MKSQMHSLVPLCRRWIQLTLLVLAAAGCDRPLPGKPKPEDEYVPPQKVLKFDVLYKQNCVACHGADGTLGAAPPLNDGLFLALVPDAELLKVITEGRPGTPMPAFALPKGGQLTEAQVKVLADGIKRQWKAKTPVPTGAPPYLAAPAQPDAVPAGDKSDGLKVFTRACASCHGDQGQGGKMAGAINSRDFLALISNQALRRYVITGRPDLGMPDYADSMGRPDDFKPLTLPDVKNLTALLASWRQGGSVNGQGN